MADYDKFFCLCGREFYQQNAYGKHQRSCKSTKKRLTGALDKAKEIWAQKKQKLVHIDLASTSASDSDGLLVQVGASSKSPSRVDLLSIAAEASTDSLHSHNQVHVCAISIFWPDITS